MCMQKGVIWVALVLTLVLTASSLTSAAILKLGVGVPVDRSFDLEYMKDAETNSGQGIKLFGEIYDVIGFSYEHYWQDLQSQDATSGESRDFTFQEEFFSAYYLFVNSGIRLAAGGGLGSHMLVDSANSYEPGMAVQGFVLAGFNFANLAVDLTLHKVQGSVSVKETNTIGGDEKLDEIDTSGRYISLNFSMGF